MDPPLHGDRNVGNRDFEQHLMDLALLNPAAGRDLFRSGVADHIQLIRLATETLEVPAYVSHTGDSIAFQGRRLTFVGHSLGAQYGAQLLAAEPRVRSAVLSAAGGGLVAALLSRKPTGTCSNAPMRTQSTFRPHLKRLRIEWRDIPIVRYWPGYPAKRC